MVWSNDVLARNDWQELKSLCRSASLFAFVLYHIPTKHPFRLIRTLFATTNFPQECTLIISFIISVAIIYFALRIELTEYN